LVALRRDSRPQRFRLVFCPALHAVPLWRGHAYLAIAGCHAVLRLPVVRFADGGVRRGGEFEPSYWLERRGIWRIGGSVSQHWLHGRAAFGGALGLGRCGPRDRDYFGGLDHHYVFVHCLVATRWRG